MRITGLTSSQTEQLKEVALTLTGKRSVSLLAKQLLLAKLSKHEQPAKATKEESILTRKKSRVEVRLDGLTKKQLTEWANAENSTINRYIAMLLINYAKKHNQTLTAYRLQSLRNSNYQLFQIGKNINQIAQALNQGAPVSITSLELEKLYKKIDEHTDLVRKVITKTPSL